MNDDRQGRPDGPTEEQIIEVVEQSGLLLEQRVGDYLESKGWIAEHSWEYMDPDEGKSRELDILAHLPQESDEDLDYSVHFHLFVECKQPRMPVVVLTRPISAHDKLMWSLDVASQPRRLVVVENLSGVRRELRAPVGKYLGPLKEAHHAYRNAYKGVQLCKVVGKGGGWDVQTGVKSQLAAPLAKASDFHSKLFYDSHPRASTFEWRWPCVFDINLCVAILGSKLYSLTVADGQARLEGRTTMPILGFYNSASLQKRWMIDVVQFEGLHEYYDNVLEASIQSIRAALRELVQGIRSGGWPIPAEHFPATVPEWAD